MVNFFILAFHVSSISILPVISFIFQPVRIHPALENTRVRVLRGSVVYFPGTDIAYCPPRAFDEAYPLLYNFITSDSPMAAFNPEVLIASIFAGSSANLCPLSFSREAPHFFHLLSYKGLRVVARAALVLRSINGCKMKHNNMQRLSM